MNADVVVIGGGPAGSSAAIRLSRSGRRVRLYEKSHFPRPKLCGGFLSPEGLQDADELGVLSALRKAGAVSLHRTIVASQRGTVIETSLPDEALSVSREVLDQLLLQEARRNGVAVFEGEDGLRHVDKESYTVIATGRLASARDTIRREGFTPWYASPRTPYFGIQALFQGVSNVSDQVELDIVKNGYVGLARQPNGVNICALMTQKVIEREGPSLDRVLAHLTTENPVLRDHVSGASRTGDWMAVGPVRLGIRQLTGEKTFYIGDAACVVDPFAGEGMAIGLYSSKLLVRALDQTRCSPMDAYTRMWKEAMMPALRWNAAMRLLYSLSAVREPVLRTLEYFPRGMALLTDLTRYRPIEDF